MSPLATICKAIVLSFGFSLCLNAATITKETSNAWDRAVSEMTAQLEVPTHPAGHLLWVESHNDVRNDLASGKILVRRVNPDDMRPVPAALMHHWRGAVLIPRATVADVVASLQDYNGYADTFAPVVIQSKLVSRQGDEFRYHLKFQQHGFGVTAGLSAEFLSRYFTVDAHSGYSTTSATQLLELQNAGALNEHPLDPAESHGFLERLYTIVRYREEHNGVYLEVETLSLSRDLPAALRWVASPLIQRFSKQVMTETLTKLRDRVLDHENLASVLEDGAARLPR